MREWARTLVAATIGGNVLYVANIGRQPSLSSAGRPLSQITRDHSLVEELVAQGKTGAGQPELYRHQKNIITRAMGDQPSGADRFL